jgi:hypothetical protein
MNVQEKLLAKHRLAALKKTELRSFLNWLEEYSSIDYDEFALNVNTWFLIYKDK